ncbi:MAG: amidohydrolase family protein [Candidatus Dormibacteria bacterium]
MISITDSQVHAPNTPHAGPIAGKEPADLLAEMDATGVDRVVVVPMMPPDKNVSATNETALAMPADHPQRFAVMGQFDLTRPEDVGLLSRWTARPGNLGVRLAFLRDPNRSLLADDQLAWFWSAAEAAGLPVMLLAPDLTDQLGVIAARYPRLPIVVDHLNLHPMVAYQDMVEAVRPLLGLAKYDNVAVKASSLPCWARDAYPFQSVHGAVEAVVGAFGPRRVFWGSDLTRLPCSYSESVLMFTEEMPFLSDGDKEWIMNRGVMEWLRWEVVGP